MSSSGHGPGTLPSGQRWFSPIESSGEKPDEARVVQMSNLRLREAEASSAKVCRPHPAQEQGPFAVAPCLPVGDKSPGVCPWDQCREGTAGALGAPAGRGGWSRARGPSPQVPPAAQPCPQNSQVSCLERGGRAAAARPTGWETAAPLLVPIKTKSPC